MTSEYSSNSMELKWLDPYTLAENPNNFRRHPQRQRASLHAALESLGWLQPLLYNSTTKRLIDGHLRRQEAIEAGVTEVPVLVVEMSEERELAALASIDSITAQAGLDSAEFSILLKGLESTNEDLVTALLGDDDLELPYESDDEDADEEHPVHLVPGEQYNYVMLLFRNELDWLSAIEHFEIDEPAIDVFHNSKVVGRTRVIEGSEYLKRVLQSA